MIRWHKFFRVFAIVLLMETLCLAIAVAQETSKEAELDYLGIIRQKMQLEEVFSQKATDALEKIVGSGRAIVMVEIEPSLERSKEQIEHWQAATREEGAGKTLGKVPKTPEFLPGIPMKQNIVEAQEKKAPGKESGQRRIVESIVKYPSFIKSMRVTVLLDERVSEKMVAACQTVVRNLLNVNEARGDTLILSTVKFSHAYVQHGPPAWLQSPWLWIFLSAIVITGVAALFLFGPIRGFLFGFLDTLKEFRKPRPVQQGQPGAQVAGGGAIGVSGGTGGMITGLPGTGVSRIRAALGEGTGGMGASVEGEEKEFEPLKYVSEEDLKGLFFLIRDEESATIATILNYIGPEKAARLVAAFPPEKQAEIAVYATRIKYTPKKTISTIDRAIKKKIDFIVGGLESFTQILDLMTDEPREALLKAVEEKDATLAGKLRRAILTFENISELDDQIVRIILSEVKTPELAVALRGADEKVRSKFTSNMAEAAQKLLSEEMEYGAPATQAQILEKRRDILATIQRLATEGKIDLGERRRWKLLDESEISEEKGEKLLEEESSGNVETPVQPDNERAFEHYNKGIELYQAGDAEAAVKEFEESLKYNNAVWQTHQYLGTCYYGLGRGEEAVQAYRRALELNPENEDLRAWLQEHAA